jgi:hypothetical protein
MKQADRITIDPEICHGKPTIRGSRYPVETMLELLSSGMTIEEIPGRLRRLGARRYFSGATLRRRSGRGRSSGRERYSGVLRIESIMF